MQDDHGPARSTARLIDAIRAIGGDILENPQAEVDEDSPAVAAQLLGFLQRIVATEMFTLYEVESRTDQERAKIAGSWIVSMIAPVGNKDTGRLVGPDVSAENALFLLTNQFDLFTHLISTVTSGKDGASPISRMLYRSACLATYTARVATLVHSANGEPGEDTEALFAGLMKAIDDEADAIDDEIREIMNPAA